MTQEEFIALAEKVTEGKASAAELALYSASYDSFQDSTVEIAAPSNIEALEKKSLRNLQESLGLPVPRIKLWPNFWGNSRITGLAVAAAVATIVFGVWFFTARHLGSPSSRTAGRDLFNDIAPGHSGATITYANGEVIQLDSAKTGVQIDPTSLTYTDGSVISRATRDLSQGRDDVMLTASTSKGQTYVFTLPDGTKVWLNAATTLKFPSTFANAKTRNVEVSGEAYFEVFRNKSQPFVVKTKKLGNIPEQEITVLGTHFNVNTYADEGRVATTLLEGSVRVSSFAASASSGAIPSSRANARDLMNKGSLTSLEMTKRGDDATLAMAKILKPGEQAKNTNGQLSVVKVETENIIDWKDGDFNLNGLDFKVAMRKISRWYDVEMIYNASVPDGVKTGGWISRESKLSDILKLIEKTGLVHFEIKGKQVYVSK